MTPEEQNATELKGRINNFIERKVWAYKHWKQDVDIQYANHNAAQMEADTMNLYENWLQATDEQTKQKYNVASRGNLLAEMIVSAGKDKWYEITWNTADIIDTYLKWFPNDSKAFYDFTHWNQDPEDFAIQMGWMEKPWLLKRWVNAIWWAIGWIAEWTWDALKRAYNNMWDIKEIAWDDNKSFIEKFNQILLWEVVLDTVWGWIGDVIWGWIEWAFKWATTQWERNKMSDAVAWFIRKALETDMWQEALERWGNLTPEQKKEAEDYLTYLDWAMNLAAFAPAKQAVTAWVRWWIKWVRTVAKEAWPIIESAEKALKAAWSWIKESIEKQATKSAIKNVAKNEAELRNIANVVWQWTTKDIDNSVKALQTLSKHTDLKSIWSRQELDNAWYSVERKLTQMVDENLSKYPWKIKASDQKIIKVDGEDEGRYVEEAIDDLLDVYKQERDYEAMNKVTKFWEEFMWDWVGYKELNDFAREYGSVMNAWNAKNQITTNAKQWWEKTRSWIKDLIRERVPANEFKDIDAEIGTIANFRKLVSKTIEGVNSTEKRLRERGITETLRKKYSDIKNTIMWVERSETENLYHIEERLPKLLERFDKLNNDIAKAENAELESIINTADKEIKALATEIKNP